jgi:hypothetical protein
MQDLTLIALDAEDLAVVSAHLQDAVLTVGEMAYLPRAKRFAVVASRFDWAVALGDNGRRPQNVRRRTGLRFERVLKARHSGIDLADKARVLSLLAIRFEPAQPAAGAEPGPDGRITLVFAGAAAVQLDVECVEAEMRDLGAAWATRRRPAHPTPGDPAPPPRRGKP